MCVAPVDGARRCAGTTRFRPARHSRARQAREPQPPHPAPRRVTSATPLQWGGMDRNIVILWEMSTLMR